MGLFGRREPAFPLPGLEPFSRQYGFDRGKPVDRWYIERFLAAHAGDVRGRVLEIYEDTYTQWYGGDRVTSNEILHKGDDNPAATINGDLSTGEGLREQDFDCFVMTQTLLLIPDVREAIAWSRRVLRDGGVCLATVPGISQSPPYEDERATDCWRFTSRGTRLLFEEVYGEGNVEVAAHGNVLTACAFLYGMAAEELTEEQLTVDDPQYELLITVRAVRA